MYNKKPKTLQHLCKQAIHKSLKEHTDGCGISHNVLQLPLPVKVKDYLRCTITKTELSTLQNEVA